MNLPPTLVDTLANLRQLLRCSNTHQRVAGAADYLPYRRGEYSPRGGTLFVLATGRSILELAPEDWEHIRQGDSIALNLFVHSPFLPDVYLFEQIPDPEVRQTWLDKVTRYAGGRPSLVLLPSYCLERIRTMPGLAVMETAIRNVFGSRFRLVSVLFARHRSRCTLPFSRWLNRRFWRHGLYHLRGSLSSAIDFGLKHDFSAIVLCGVDLNEHGYFYGPRHEKGVVTPDPEVPPVHFTDQAVRGLIPISDWLHYVVESETGTRFWCSSAQSRLSDWMPVYSWPSGRKPADRRDTGTAPSEDTP